MKVEGLKIIRNVFNVTEQKQIVSELQKQPLALRTDGRRVIQYGPVYQLPEKRVRPGRLELPEVGKKLRRKLQSYLANPKQPFNQSIINEYPPGIGHYAHRDDLAFGPVLGTFSFGVRATLRMTHVKTKQKRTFLLPPGSLYLVRGAARTQWQHEILPIAGNGQHQPRIAWTFRHVANEGQRLQTWPDQQP